jgi:hypothetical protein
MKAFHGDPKVKAKYLARVRAHRKADQLVKGYYWEHGKGCAVGCTVHSSSHTAYETELGIPRILARLEDGIFEALPNGDAMVWPENFLAAIEPGADLALVWPRFAVWMLADETWGVLQFAKSERAKRAILAVSDAYRKVVGGEKVDVEVWRDLRAAAYAAAYAADADAAAYAAAAACAAAATDAAAAADAAADAADAAADAAAAAGIKWRKAQAKKFLQLLRDAPASAS